MIFTLVQRKADVDRKIRAIPKTIPTVVTATVRRQTLKLSFIKEGTIEANNQIAVVSQVQGTVVAVYAHVGSNLKAGDPIFKIDDATLRSKLVSAKTAYDVARKEWERAQTLHQEQVISDSDLESYEQTYQTNQASLTAAQQDYNHSTITSPVSGIMTDRPIDLGATVVLGTTVATIIDNSMFKLKLNVGEKEAFKLKFGDTVLVETDVYPGVKLNGHINSISDQSDAAHTFPVEIALSNTKKYPLKAGIFGQAEFQLGTEYNVLTIPREAVVGSIKTPKVYVTENGKVKLRDIIIGSENDTQLVVIQGLNENDQVVVSGQDDLMDNMAVKLGNH
jgi:RND family efflux transporter MFP subunit